MRGKVRERKEYEEKRIMMFCEMERGKGDTENGGVKQRGEKD